MSHVTHHFDEELVVPVRLSAIAMTDILNQPGNPIHQPCSPQTVCILHELDVGQHTLFILSDGSIDLLANDEAFPYLADNILHLSSDEVYKVFISLQEQFRQKEM